MTERPPLSRVLRESTRLLHTDAERAGAMGALLRGRIDRETYVAMLSALHAIYGSLEDALHRNADHASITPMLVPGLERRDALAADLRALAGDSWPLTHPPHDLAVTYAAHLSTLGNNAPERLIAHAWLRYLGDLNGGQIVARIVRNSLSLDESSTAFYAFPDLDDPMRVAGEWRTALDALPLSGEAQEAIVSEAADGFRRHIALFEGLAAQDDTASSAAPSA